MRGIGGNINAVLQVPFTVRNRLGEAALQSWCDVIELTGWLDLSGGDSKYTPYHAKVQESTHVFICDYCPIPEIISIDGKSVKVSAENTTLVVNSKRYDVMLIDDPMGMHQQIEIYLKYTGGQ